MDQRRAGVLVLVGAIVVVGLMALGRPVDMVGDASRAPLPTPPEVGECIEGGRLWIEVPVVPCTQPHTLEVTARWLAEDPARSIAHEFGTCQDKGTDYTTAAPTDVTGGWTTSLNLQAFTVDAPEDESFGDQGWVVCAIAPMIDAGKYVGSLRGPYDADRPRPGAAGKCRGEIGIGYEAEVSCVREHGSEIIAEQAVTVITDYTQAQVDAAQGEMAVPTDTLTTLSTSCVTTAAVLIGVDDPTYGGALLVAAESDGYFAAVGDDQSFLYASCVVRTADHRGLVGSVVGLGEGPIPYAS